MRALAPGAVLQWIARQPAAGLRPQIISRTVRRSAVLTGILVAGLLAGLAGTADASSSISVSFGSHGAAKLTTGGPTSVFVNLKALANGRWAEALYAGSCAHLGVKITGLPALVVATGVAKRTDTLTSSIGAAARRGLLRIAKGSTVLCASFAPVAVPRPTPSPTSTPSPTPTPTPTPTPSGISYVQFPAVVLSGTGDGVVRFGAPAGMKWAAITILTNSDQYGPANFIVSSLASDGSTIDSLVNVIGAYDGSVLVDRDGSQATAFAVTAVGQWSIILSPVSAAPTWDGTGTKASGGDHVFQLVPQSSGLTVAALANVGSSNFVIWSFTSAGDAGATLLVNEIGNYSGSKVLPSGTGLVAIESDGTWSISLSH